MADNPFTLMFGKEPYLIIKREQIISKKPWFAQVTWQMVSCDIITFGQQ